MKLVGLTGGFASGKSTVREMLRRLGADVLDADGIYHLLIAAKDGQPSSLGREIEARFPGVLERDGSVNRKELGRRVFGDAKPSRASRTRASESGSPTACRSLRPRARGSSSMTCLCCSRPTSR